MNSNPDDGDHARILPLPVSGALLLTALLALAALLRLAHLDTGLRHTPHQDERLFVEATVAMLARGDLDYGFYEYGGLFIYLLAPWLSPLDPPRLGADTYLAARTLVAAFGVASVGVVFMLARRLAGWRAGVVAAALLAVSPVEVQTAHMVRPDVALECFVLLALIAFDRLDGSQRRDLQAGIAIGVATALKFSGALLGPCYALLRLLQDRAAWRRLSLAGVVSVLAFLVLSPYAVLNVRGFRQGVDKQLAYHYEERGTKEGYGGNVAAYGRILVRALGAPGVGLALAGVVVYRRDWRRLSALLAFPLIVVAVFSTAEVHRDRFLVPALGAIAVWAGLAVERLWARSRWLAAAAGLLAVAVPLRASARYVEALGLPATRDLAVDWVEAHVPAGARILTSVEDLGLDRGRYEVVVAQRIDSGSRILARQMDLLVSGPADDEKMMASLPALFVAEPTSAYAWKPLIVTRFPDALRPVYVTLHLEPSALHASSHAELLPALLDGRADTAWWAEAGDSTLVVRLDASVLVGRLELPVGGRPFVDSWRFEIEGSEDLETWHRLNVFLARPPLLAQRPPLSHVFVWKPALLKGLRVSVPGSAWGASELRLGALRGATP